MTKTEALNLQAFESRNGEYEEQVGARFNNAILTAVLFRAGTDIHDTPLSQKKVYAFANKLAQTEGHLFFLALPAEDLSVIYIAPTPDIITPSISMEKGVLRIVCGDYPIYRGTCRIGDEASLCRSWYKTLYKPQKLVSMSNTWGDRGGRDVVTEMFVRNEIEWAQKLGVDVVQVDDGWQKTAPNTFDEQKLRVFEGDFWDVRSDAFPHGIERISPYAAERGVETGLWFAPHSRNDFEYFDRDIAILRRAYKEWGFRYFKLDMLQLNSISQCKRAEKFFDEIFSFGPDVTVELDVTADRRMGYLASAPYGTLFVENRYTAWQNYYPHATLRNLWHLAKYIPSSKLQFELVNPTRFAEKYQNDDILRPALYDIDYLFASVMVSNPLFWMEMQYLPQREAKRLCTIVSTWKKWRGELVCADVIPFGEEPSGCSLTGFIAETENAFHVILLREVTERDTFSLAIDTDLDVPTLLASNTEVNISTEDNVLTATLSAPRSYAWIRFTRK